MVLRMRLDNCKVGSLEHAQMDNEDRLRIQGFVGDRVEEVVETGLEVLLDT